MIFSNAQSKARLLRWILPGLWIDAAAGKRSAGGWPGWHADYPAGNATVHRFFRRIPNELELAVILRLVVPDHRSLVDLASHSDDVSADQLPDAIRIRDRLRGGHRIGRRIARDPLRGILPGRIRRIRIAAVVERRIPKGRVAERRATRR